MTKKKKRTLYMKWLRNRGLSFKSACILKRANECSLPELVLLLKKAGAEFGKRELDRQNKIGRQVITIDGVQTLLGEYCDANWERRCFDWTFPTWKTKY